MATLLIIDDLGAERGTEYAVENVFNVIDKLWLVANAIGASFKKTMSLLPFMISVFDLKTDITNYVIFLCFSKFIISII